MNEIIMKEENIGNIGILKVSKNLQQIIDYLHLKVGATEWSGILFYKLTKGNIDTLKDLEFTAEFVYPMNIGNSAYTEFDYTGEVVNAYDLYEQAIEMNSGLIHSHHNMTTFFSGTDSSELRDNAAKYNYYVSLIVNFAHVYCAKIAIPTKTEVTSKSWFKNTLGKLVPINRQSKEDILLIGDLTVEIENDVPNPEWLEKRIKDLQIKNLPKITSSSFGVNSFGDDWDANVFREINSFNRSKDLPIKSQIKYSITPNNFLCAWLDPNTTSISTLPFIFTELKDLNTMELEQFEEALESNLEIIHDELYGSNDNFRSHCLEALLVLTENSKRYSKIPAFDIIDSILGEYATI